MDTVSVTLDLPASGADPAAHLAACGGRNRPRSTAATWWRATAMADLALVVARDPLPVFDIRHDD